jgi:hypothetical protein
MPIESYGVIGLLGQALTAQTPESNRLAQLARLVESSLSVGQAAKLDFIGAIPAMKRWAEKARQNGRPIPYKYQIIIDRFETSIDIPVEWEENDKTGLVQDRIGQVPQRRSNLYGQRVADLILNGTTGTAFDEASFYNASHTWGGNSYSNTINIDVATPTDPTPLEIAQAIVDIVSRFDTFVDDRGEPLKENMSRIGVTCAPALSAPIMQALSQNTLDTGAGVKDNPVLGLRARGIEIMPLISTPRLTSTTKFQVHDMSPGCAPFVIARNPAMLKMTMKGAGSDYEHDTGHHAYGVQEDLGSGYGLPADSIEATLVLSPAPPT